MCVCGVCVVKRQLDDDDDLLGDVTKVTSCVYVRMGVCVYIYIHIALKFVYMLNKKLNCVHIYLGKRSCY